MPGRGKPLRILCIGDSLTSGWCQRGIVSHPYSTQFKATLEDALPAYNVEVYTDGGPGDMVTYPRWTSRLKSELSKRTIDWVVMLGGANDIGGVCNAEETFQSLKSNWDVATSRGAKVLALTLLENRIKSAYLEKDRNDLNRSILKHKAPNFYSYDLQPQIPFHSLNEEERSRLWDPDGAHLTTTGYDKMGQIIAGALISILEQQGHIPVPQFFSDPAFEEEGGNPKNLKEGYIVIRRKDLE